MFSYLQYRAGISKNETISCVLVKLHYVLREVIHLINLEPTIKDVLSKMQLIAPTVVTGGYLRDTIIGIPPNDVDILTEMKIADVQKLFPQLTGTERGLNFGVGRFSLKGIPFEITCLKEQSILEAISEKDFILNSLYHDGKRLIDIYGGVEDIQNKVIRFLEDPKIHFQSSPQAYLRAIRLSANLGFQLDEQLFLFLQENVHIFHDNNDSRIQQEGYKIIRSRFPIYAFELLAQLHLLPYTPTIKKVPLTSYPDADDKVYMRLLLIAEHASLEYIHAFINLFQLTNNLKEQMHTLLPYLANDKIPSKPLLLNKVITFKRLQYQDNPEKLKVYMDLIRSNSNNM